MCRIIADIQSIRPLRLGEEKKKEEEEERNYRAKI